MKIVLIFMRAHFNAHKRPSYWQKLCVQPGCKLCHKATEDEYYFILRSGIINNNIILSYELFYFVVRAIC